LFGLQLHFRWLSRDWRAQGPHGCRKDFQRDGAIVLEGVSMKNMIKGATLVALAAMGLSLSACGGGSSGASAAATPDPADQTAASIDAAVPAPVESPPAGSAAAAAMASEAAAH
jgi:hypothetical protein